MNIHNYIMDIYTKGADDHAYPQEIETIDSALQGINKPSKDSKEYKLYMLTKSMLNNKSKLTENGFVAGEFAGTCLAGFSDEITRAKLLRPFIRDRWIEEGAIVNTSNVRSSYGLKHRAEEIFTSANGTGKDYYVGNGVMIALLIDDGYDFIRVDGDSNAMFILEERLIGVA